MPDDNSLIITSDGDMVTVQMPASKLAQFLGQRAAVLTDPSIRKATLKDAKTILDLEALAFPQENESSADTAETDPAVIEKFLGNGGEIFLLARDSAFFERIPLESMLKMKYSDLSTDSPLRQIGERRDLLQRAQQAYEGQGREVWYMHGIGSAYRGIGDASRLIEHSQQPSGLLEKLGMKGKISFGYIDIGPQDNINVPSFRLTFGHGAIADGFETEVYSKGVPYLRVSYGSTIKLNQDDRRAVDLRKETYLSDIREAFTQGYVGTQLLIDSNRKPTEMIFCRKA